MEASEEDLRILAELKEKLGKSDEQEFQEPTEEDIAEMIKRIRACVDYEVGDWVETCHMLPGIVQKIDIENDEVLVFYPHYALKTPGEYNGYSCCSIEHCGVHKITSEYACKLLAIGEDRLKELWEEMCKEYDEKEEPIEVPWSDYVERLYNEIYSRRS